MTNSSDSQCYFVQLQIDGFLDGDLSETQQGVFMSHVHDCADCAKEFRFAQTVQDAVLELPRVDCNEYVLEPIHRLSNSETQGNLDSSSSNGSFISQLMNLINTVPVFMRVGVPVAAATVLGIMISSSLLNQGQNQELSVPQVVAEVSPQYAPEEISQALEDLNLAIDYLNKVNQRTEVMISERFLVNPLQASLNASFQRARLSDDDPLQNDPI